MITKWNSPRSNRKTKKQKQSAVKLFSQLLALMEQLRGPKGCSWDRKQTNHSIRLYLLEEAHEALEALSGEQWENFREELGDLLFQIVFHSSMTSDSGRFDISDVLSGILRKLKFRHPHLFGDKKVRARTMKEQWQSWEELKAQEKQGPVLARVPKSMPALLQASTIQKRADRLGFRWKRLEDVKEKVKEEVEEWLQACEQGNRKEREEELGDLLFTLAHLAEWLELNAEEALQKANLKFRKRFAYLEKICRETGRKLKNFSEKELDQLWNQAKMEITKPSWRD